MKDSLIYFGVIFGTVLLAVVGLLFLASASCAQSWEDSGFSSR